MIPTVKIVTNELQSGDWVKVYADSRLIHQGHDISYWDMLDIFRHLGIAASKVELTDFELDEYEARG